jgi:TRAP-type C4-dicarboxylate transport system permease small subunit
MNKKLVNRLLNLDLVVAGTMLALLILFTFCAVVMRYVVRQPITWGEEFQLLAMVVIVFFGAGAGFRFKSHVAIDVVVDLFPAKVQKALGLVIFALTLLILAYFFIHSVFFVRQMFATDRVTNILKIPYGLIYSSFPVSCILMILNYCLRTFKPGLFDLPEEA